MNLCEYGCETEAKYTLKNGKKCCSKSYQQCVAIREKNSEGLKKSHANGKGYKFDSSARTKSIATKKKNALNVFLSGEYNASNSAIKERLKDLGIKQCCSECGIDTWNGKKIPLELDHINGNSKDNSGENLRLLCPNCHSLTDTWRGKNINTGKIKVSDDEILTAYKKTANIRQTLLEVGLAPKGGNYARVKKLIK